MDSSNKAERVFHEQISRSEEKEQMAGQGQLGAADAVRPDAARVYAVSLCPHDRHHIAVQALYAGEGSLRQSHFRNWRLLHLHASAVSPCPPRCPYTSFYSARRCNPR